MRKKYHFFIVILLFFGACDKDQDDIPPTINWNEPFENSTYNVLETVPISAVISDDKQLETIVLRLISYQSSNQVLPAQSFNPSTKEYQVSSNYVLNDSLLASGDYYFQLEANDGENSFSAFRDIRINGIPKRKLAVLVSCSDSLTTDVYVDQNNFTFSIERSFSFPYLASTVNSHDQHYWFLPLNNNQLNVYQLVNKNIAYTESYLSGFNQTFTDIVGVDRDVIIGVKDGEIDGFNQNFNDNYTYQITNERIVDKIAVGSKYIAITEEERSGNNKTINVLLKNTGFSILSLSITENMEEMYFHNDDEAVLFYNTTSGGVIAELDVANVGIRTMNSLSSQIVNVLQLNSNDYIIATSNGIQRYTLSSNNLVPYLSESDAVLAYDELDNQLYVGDGLQLKRYNLGQLSSNASYSFPKTIKGIDIRYNKN